MSDEDKLGLAVLFLIVGLLMFFIGWQVSSAQWRSEAVEEGHAEFYLDRSNVRQWRWYPGCRLEWRKKNGEEEKVKSSEEEKSKEKEE